MFFLSVDFSIFLMVRCFFLQMVSPSVRVQRSLQKVPGLNSFSQRVSQRNPGAIKSMGRSHLGSCETMINICLMGVSISFDFKWHCAFFVNVGGQATCFTFYCTNVLQAHSVQVAVAASTQESEQGKRECSQGDFSDVFCWWLGLRRCLAQKLVSFFVMGQLSNGLAA